MLQFNVFLNIRFRLIGICLYLIDLGVDTTVKILQPEGLDRFKGFSAKLKILKDFNQIEGY